MNPVKDSPSAPAAGMRMPRQLPAVTNRVWVDRTRELAVLNRLAANPGPLRVILTGLPGVGKTALASRWLLEQTADFPDGELYVDLGGEPDAPAPRPEQVLAAWLRALGLPTDDIPHERGELAALFRTVAAERALLILVDNASSGDLVRPLLPSSPRSVVLVTSRHQLPELTMDRFDHLHLECLSAEDGAAMLAGVLRSHPADLTTLTKLSTHCAGLPLALAIAGGHLTLRSHRSPAALLTQLDANPRHLLDLHVGDQTIGAVMDMTYRELPPDLARLFRLCAIHPGREFTPAPLAAAWLRKESDTERALARLLDANRLVEIGQNRYRLHDLIYDHARTHVESEDDPDDRDAAEYRMIDWYLRHTAHADRILNPDPPRFGSIFTKIKEAKAPPPFRTYEAAMTWVNTERITLIAAQRRAADQGWDKLAAQLGEALWNPMRLAATAAELLDTQRLGAAAAAQCTEPMINVVCLIRAAYAETNLERHDAAIATATAALDRATSIEDDWTRSWARSAALSTRARAHTAADNPRAALTDLPESRTLAEHIGSERSIALRHQRMGEALAHRQVADYSAAINHLQLARTGLRAMNDGHGNARVTITLAKVYVQTGDPHRALAELNQVIDAVRAENSANYLADLYTALAQTHAALGDLPTAHRWHTDAIEQYEAAGRATTARYRNVVAARDALDEEPSS